MRFKNKIDIGGKFISHDSSVFIIAEISANHNNDISRAKEIIRQASICGADAIKLQTYTADTITLDTNKEDFIIEGGLWDGRSLYDIYSEGSLPWEWHEELISYARDLGLAVISSPFDETAVDFLIDLGIDALKIASFEINHIPLIEYAASKGLPIIMSTGMANDDEINEAVEAVGKHTDELILLHCISSYPARAEEFGLKSILDLKETYSCLSGLSDHCTDNLIASASVALGTTVIEKHFTLDRKGGGLDDSFSLEPEGLKELRENVDLVKAALVKPNNGCSNSEKSSLKYRRSIYASRPISEGEIFTEENLKVIRPGAGLHPRHYYQLIGRRAKRDVDFAEPLLTIDLMDL